MVSLRRSIAGLIDRHHEGFVTRGRNTSSTISAGAAAGVAASVHGYSVAMAWGVAIVLAAAVPIVVLIDASKPARRS